MSSNPHQRLRPEPGISANELARYLVAGDHAREGIIRRAKEIATAPVIRYRDLRQGLAGYLADPLRPVTRLNALEQMLDQKANDSSLSQFSRDDAQASLEALEVFRRFTNQLGGMSFQTPPRWRGSLMIEGVSVNVYPDLALVQDARDGPRYGVVLFRLAKGDDGESEAAATRRTETAKYVATLAHMHAGEQCLEGHAAHHSLCMSIDVQNQVIVAASRSRSRRESDIRAACRTIARAWGAV